MARVTRIGLALVFFYVFSGNLQQALATTLSPRDAGNVNIYGFGTSLFLVVAGMGGIAMLGWVRKR